MINGGGVGAGSICLTGVDKNAKKVLNEEEKPIKYWTNYMQKGFLESREFWRGQSNI